MKKCLAVLISLGVIISVLFAVTAVNNRGRIDCGNVTNTVIEESGPLILMGGQYSEKDGKEIYTLTFSIDSKIYIFPETKQLCAKRMQRRAAGGIKRILFLYYSG